MQGGAAMGPAGGSGMEVCGTAVGEGRLRHGTVAWRGGGVGRMQRAQAARRGVPGMGEQAVPIRIDCVPTWTPHRMGNQPVLERGLICPVCEV